MKRALIGNTGFVGSNLDRQLTFTHRYNSKNIQDIQGESFDEIVCAGVQAVKWWANTNPEEDWAGIERLLSMLDTVKAEHFTLISTVDVYKNPTGVDENSSIQTDGLHTYGLHRWRVEEWIRSRYTDALILRLPGLYGSGLKKNLIFDVLKNRDLSGFDAKSRFQFYNLDRIAEDIKIARANELSLLNVAVAPVSVADVVRQINQKPFNNTTQTPALAYDMRTIHSRHWNSDGNYLSSSAECLDQIDAYARQWRSE